MITAAGQQSKLLEALKIGAKKFITKPFEKEEVLNNVKDVID
jgi:DNA-binding response OmpR family regulator